MLWQTKLHARLHDPAEKALVLMRDPGVSHEEGSVRTLREAVFGTPEHAGAPQKEFVKRADWWASSADRAPFPSAAAGNQRGNDWQQVRFADNPCLVHPISGKLYDIGAYAGDLRGLSVSAIKSASLLHFQGLIQRREGEVDLQKTLLAYWRFGPELQDNSLRALWSLLPADTRTPDHTIWQHLDLTSAFAGAFAADENDEAALLTVSFGPIQEFIAVGRSTSDLWAGSHFLSCVAWEGLRVICEQLGPDAVLFPQLRGVPLVDAWLASEKGLDPALFNDADWKRKRTDANPLFIAALPNKFLAVVPASRVEALAAQVRDAMRSFVMRTGRTALERVLQESGKVEPPAPHDIDDPSLPCFLQLEAQLKHFPEVHWAAVPFALAAGADGVHADDSKLKPLLAHFHTDANAPGFLGSPAWKAFRGLSRKDASDTRPWFWEQRPAALYPALYDLVERSLAATKSLRVFDGGKQHGYRCSLSAEVEWLTTDRAQLNWTRNQCTQNGTLWTRLTQARPSWVKPREHLGALAMLKRLWPTLFVDQVRAWTGIDIQRFVVSSHALALSTTLSRWLDNPTGLDSEAARDIQGDSERSALPGSVAREHIGGIAFDIASRIPDYLDRGRDGDEHDRQRKESHVKTLLGRKPETYYALVLMDGDQMGKWLSGDLAPTYEAMFHPQIRNAIRTRFADQATLSAYLQAPRAPSPAYHSAISSALNGFALQMAQRVTERAHKGKLLYAGGDDLMALCASDDLPSLMAGLRAAYSGSAHNFDGASDIGRCGQGHALVDGRLVRLMGEQASASVGAVIAHMMAPLNAVLRELRTAEPRAKTAGGRDAFSLSLVKRSGGAVQLTAKWRYGDLDTLHVLEELRNFLARDEVSRRAVYNSLQWLKDLPEPEGDGEMLRSLLSYQFARQAKSASKLDAPVLAARLVALTMAEHQRQTQLATGDAQPKSALAFLETFLTIAEFLAREQRKGAKA